MTKGPTALSISAEVLELEIVRVHHLLAEFAAKSMLVDWGLERSERLERQVRELNAHCPVLSRTIINTGQSFGDA